LERSINGTMVTLGL